MTDKVMSCYDRLEYLLKLFYHKLSIQTPHGAFSDHRVMHTGTGTKFSAYPSPSPMLNDISLEKLSKFTLNTNYIHYHFVMHNQPINIHFMLKKRG